MNSKIVVCGLGGQGVIFLTRLLAKTAVSAGHPVMVSETHGMSQRGGSVISHLKIGGNQAPLIQPGTAHFLFAMDPEEAVRSLYFLRKNGTAFINSENGLRPEVAPHLERLGIQVCSLPASQMAVDMGSAAVANVILAGFASAHPTLNIGLQDLQATLKAAAKRGAALNLQALNAGFQAGGK